MTYIDEGWDNYCRKPMGTGSQSYSSVSIDALLENLSARKINVGTLQSQDGKTTFNLSEGRILINDGTNDRVLIGRF